MLAAQVGVVSQRVFLQPDDLLVGAGAAAAPRFGLRGGGARVVAADELVFQLGAEVDADGAAQRQVLEDVQLPVHVANHLVDVGLVAGLEQVAHRVVEVLERIGAVRTVGLAHGHRGGLGQGPEHRARVADALFAARTAVGHRAAQVERGAGPEALADLLLEVGLEVEPVEARVQADAVLLEVAAREVVAGFVGAAAHVQLVALNGGRAVDFVLPVGVGGQVVQVRVARGPAGINLGFVKVLGKLAGIKQVNPLAQRLLAVVGA